MATHRKSYNTVLLNTYKQNHRCDGGNPNTLKSADFNRSGRIRYQRQETTTNIVSPTSTSYERRSLRTRITPTLFEIQKVPKACRDGERPTTSSTTPEGYWWSEKQRKQPPRRNRRWLEDPNELTASKRC